MQKRQYAKKQAEKFERLAENSLDEGNKRRYSAREEAWKDSIEEKTLENIAESDIIKIESPLNQRNTGKGNPNAILQYDVELNKRQQKVLDRLPNSDDRVVVSKKSINMSDLSALTAKTGHEFAMFTRGSERLIIRGTSGTVNITTEEAKKLAQQGYRFSGHTHPGIDFNCLIASPGDYKVLEAFGQKQNVIYNSKGQFLTYNL